VFEPSDTVGIVDSWLFSDLLLMIGAMYCYYY